VNPAGSSTSTSSLGETSGGEAMPLLFVADPSPNEGGETMDEVDERGEDRAERKFVEDCKAIPALAYVKRR
jgi:hypothetical protein